MGRGPTESLDQWFSARAGSSRTPVGHQAVSGDIWGCCHGGGGRGGERPGMLLNILQCTGQSHSAVLQPRYQEPWGQPGESAVWSDRWELGHWASLGHGLLICDVRASRVTFGSDSLWCREADLNWRLKMGCDIFTISWFWSRRNVEG